MRTDHPTRRRCWVTVVHHKRGGKRVHIGAHDQDISPLRVVGEMLKNLPDEDRVVVRDLLWEDSISGSDRTRAQQISWTGDD